MKTFLNTVHLNVVQYTQIMFAEHHPARHDRESVTDTALRLLDQLGLPDLTMRRLASELGVQPSALYWHFASKQALLAAIADRILARIDAGVSSAEPDAVLRVAQSIRDALFTYRDGAEVVMSAYALGLGADSAHTGLVEAIRPFAPADADNRAAVLLQFILGHALLVQQRLHAESHGAAAASVEIDASAALEATFDIGVRVFLSALLPTDNPSGV